MASKSEEVEGDDEESSSPIGREKTESKLQVRVTASSEITKMTSLHEHFLNTLTESVDSS